MHRKTPARFLLGVCATSVLFVAILLVKNRGEHRNQVAPIAPERSIDGSQSATEVALTNEFQGSYPAEASPTGIVREFSVTAAPAQVQLFDGRVVSVWAYNGQVPGPTLRIRLGETLRVLFTNNLEQPSTIHWHGVRVPNNMDGVPGVTQRPVHPGESFTYEFTPKDAGTFWFHPHIRSSEQIERGLFGVLIVEDAQPQPYTRDVVWVLDDWLLTNEGEIFPEFNTRHDLMHDGRWGNKITVNGDEAASLTVRPGERVRLRLLNVANGRVFAPNFSSGDPQIIAVDGMYTARPIPLGGYELAPGNRLDLDVFFPEALGDTQIFVQDRFTRTPIPLVSITVSGEPVAPVPHFASPPPRHVPLWENIDSEGPRFELRLTSRSGGQFGIQWTLNDVTMEHNQNFHDHPIEPYQLPYAHWSKVRFTNQSYRLHPMHIHGMFFKLLSRNGVRVNEPHWRDTVLVHPRETVDVGLVPEDKGKWMLHCHILEHAESGMMTLVEVW